MELDIHDPNYTEKLLTESKKYKSKSRPVGPVQSDAIYDDGKFRNCAWVTGKLNEQDAEIARLKGLCQDYHSEADSRDAEIARLKYSIEMYQKGSIAAKKQEFNDVKLIKLLSNENEQLKAQLEKARKHLTDIKQPGDLVPQIEKAIAVLEIGG